MFVWLAVVGGIAAFAMAFGIGSNDAANAFGTSVGSKALTYRQAVLAGTLMEFLGAALMGKSVADTVRKGVVDSHGFAATPYVLMLAMFCALVGAAIWLQLCTRWGVPVSTTHSVVGGIVGAALAAHGGSGVNWATLGLIVASWVISPVLTALVAVTLFASCRRLILRRANIARGLALFPALVFVTVLVNAFFVIYKGAPAVGLADVGAGTAAGAAIAIAAGLAAVAQLAFGRALRRRAAGPPAEAAAGPPAEAAADPPNESSLCSASSRASEASSEVRVAVFEPGVVLPGGAALDARAADAHAAVERFSPESERLFSGLQVVTAVLNSFAHGANDVANAIGPFAAIVGIYRSGAVKESAEVPLWILVMGGAGISLGLATLGYRVIRTVGLRLVAVTPSRGFAIELAAAAVVVVASQAGIPISTTHCIVGAAVGVGLVEADWRAAVHWRLLVKVFAGWLVTLAFAGACSALLFAFAAYSPTVV